MPSVVRKGDICSGHEAWPPRPNDQGSEDVYVNDIALHRVDDHWTTHSGDRNTHDAYQSGGALNVFANNKQVARVGDDISCGSVNAQGSSNVFCGGYPYPERISGYMGPAFGDDLAIPSSLEYYIQIYKDAVLPPLQPIIDACSPLIYETYPWAIAAPLTDGTSGYGGLLIDQVFYDDPTYDGVSFNVNLGGAEENWAFTYFQVYNSVNDNRYYSPSVFYDSYYPGTVGAPNAFNMIHSYNNVGGTLTNSIVTSRYDAMEWFDGRSGHFVFPGVATTSDYSSISAINNTGEPLLFEAWFSLNPNRSDPLNGYNNYTTFSDLRLSTVDLPENTFYLKNYFGIVKANANSSNLSLSDMIAVVLYEGGASGGTYKAVINGVVIQEETVTERVSYISSSVYSNLFSQAPLSITNGKASIVTTLSIGSIFINKNYFDLSSPPEDLPFAIDTYQSKLVLYTETDFSANPTMSSNVSIQFGMCTFPNTVLPCAPATPQPAYVPGGIVVPPPEMCQPYTVSVYPWLANTPRSTSEFSGLLENSLVFDDPTLDGVTLNVNFGGYALSWDYNIYTWLFNNSISNGYDLYTPSITYKPDIPGPADQPNWIDFQHDFYGDDYAVLQNPDLITKYAALNSCVAGHNVFPGVSSISSQSFISNIFNYGQPVLYEVWFSLNPNRSNPLVGYNNYTIYGNGNYNVFADVPIGGFFKKFYYGIFKVNADLSNLQMSDIIAAISYEGGISGGTYKSIVNGLVIDTVDELEAATTISATLNGWVQCPIAILGENKSAIASMVINNLYTIRDNYVDYTTNTADYPFFIDTYQTKKALYIDSDFTNADPFFTPGGIYLSTQNMCAIPNESLLCAPTTPQPAYVPAPPVL